MPPEAITSPPADFAPAAPEPAVEAAPASEAPPATPEAPAAPETDLFEDEKVSSFDRAYVSKLREEAAARRKEASRFKEIYGDYPEEAQQVWFDLATTWKTDPQAAAKMMEEIVASVKAGEEPPAPVADPAAPGGALTPEAVQEMIAKSQADFQKEQALQAQTKALISEAEGLGYKMGTPDYRDLFNRAQFDHGGDLKAAHTAREAYKQAVIDGFVKAKGATAGPQPINQGAAPGTRTVPKTWAEAAAALRASEGALPGQ